MVLEDTKLMDSLAAQKFDLAIVDLIANECSLALARSLRLPVASYWGFGFQVGDVLQNRLKIHDSENYFSSH